MGSSTSSTSALCTQQEHPFLRSPSRETCCDVVLGHSCLAALCSLVYFTGGSLGPETSLTATPSSVCRGKSQQAWQELSAGDECSPCLRRPVLALVSVV